MTDIQATVTSLVTNIKNEVAVDANLAELKVILGALNSTQLTDAAKNIPVPVIIDCLNSQNGVQIATGCDVLNLILPTFSSNDILMKSDVSLPLSKCLKHADPAVKTMALQEIKRHMGSDEMAYFLGNNSRQIIDSIIDCLCDDETSVGLKAAELLSSLGQLKIGAKLLSHPVIAASVIEKTKFSETHRIRLYQALVDISLTSADSLRSIESQGYFRDMISCIKTDDVLANLSILEVITPLAMQWHGYSFLSRNGIIQFLAEIMASAESHPLKSLFFPGVVKFFGHLGQKYSQQLAIDYPTVLGTIFRMTESIEESIFITSLETIGVIAYSTAGKNLLMSEPLMNACMKRVYAAITQVPTHWRVRGLAALSKIIHVKPSDTTWDTSAVVQSWFEEMSPQGFESIADMARQPFPELSTGALEVLIELAPMKWGQTKIASNQALLDCLFDANEESNPEIKEVKMKLLKVLAGSETSPTVFGEEVFRKIKLGADEVKPNGAAVLLDMMSL